MTIYNIGTGVNRRMTKAELRAYDALARRRRTKLPNPLPRPADERDEQRNYQLARRKGNR